MSHGGRNVRLGNYPGEDVRREDVQRNMSRGECPIYTRASEGCLHAEMIATTYITSVFVNFWPILLLHAV